jgi:hypothetical protein
VKSSAGPLITVEEAFRLRLNGINGGGCPVCRAAGEHRPWCTRPDLRKCRKCAAPIPFAGLGVRYCQACREAPRCPRCMKPAGGHNPTCSWLRPNRRPVPTFQGVVTIQMLVELYERERAHLVRIAARICGNEAEDIVQGVFAYFVARLDTLTHLDKKLAMIAVVKAAKRELTAARRKHTVQAEDVALDLLERYAAQSHWLSEPV